MTRWLKAKGESELAASTLERYGQIIERFIVPRLGAVAITKLNSDHIEAAVTAWRKMPVAKNPKQLLSRHTVHHIYATLRTALNWAKRRKLIMHNPCDNVETVSKGKTAIRAIDEKQGLTLIERLRGTDLECPVLVAIMTGLRRGELLALTWADVDMERKCLHVRRSLEVVGASELRFKEPKTANSRRTIPLPHQAITALKRHRVAQLEARLRFRDAYDVKGDLVFPRFDGTPWHPKRFSSAFHRRMKSLKIPVSFHGLRHSYASILLRAGAPLKVTSAALGHANIAITADTYTHVLGELQREAADRLSVVFDEAEARRA